MGLFEIEGRDLGVGIAIGIEWERYVDGEVVGFQTWEGTPFKPTWNLNEQGPARHLEMNESQRSGEKRRACRDR